MKLPIRILLVESHPVTRIGIKTVFETENNLQIVGEAASGADAIKLHKDLQPDVTLYELRMPDVCGVDAVGQIHDASPNTRIIICAENAGDAEITRSLENGASGYLLKDAAPAELLKAVRAVHGGRKYISPEIARALAEHLGEETVTPAEKRVLEMIVAGFSNKEIAANLAVTENTVKTHVKNIFSKLGVGDRTAAAMSAIKRGIVRADV